MNKDLYLLMEILNSNKNFSELKLNGTILSYQGSSIDLKILNMEYFFSQNPRFKDEAYKMTPEAIFNILKLHVDFIQAENEKKEKKAKEYIDTTPILKQFEVIKRKDSEKVEHSYIRYVDNNGTNHVLENVDYKELFDAYKEIMQSDKAVKTDKDIFDFLKMKHKEILLEDLHAAEKRPDASEQHLNILKKLRDDNSMAMEQTNELVGNDNNHIYINNNKVITIDQNQEGKVIETKHDSETKENDSVDSITVQDKIKLISFSEYVELIVNKETLSSDEKDKIRVFEAFLFDIITYKDYLTPELYDIYQKWTAFYEKLYFSTVMTPVIQETLKNYESMQERSSKVTITNPLEKVAELKRKNPEEKASGYVGATIYIILTILIGVVIAYLIFAAS